ncbi:MAG: hypothetical protein COS41_04365 [Elusimicrobia bacterium CG03_land_8_20_14_0_80_50_18]|nr:MAG: hypothetical protein COS41_04365 [Elusimicrobia bacterium CG03_land_8_20_14_0_80_50_18]
MKHSRKKKKNKRRHLSGGDRLKKKVAKLGFHGVPIIESHEKMSELLLEFAEPLLENSDNDHNAIGIAVIAWNMAIITRGIFKRVLRYRMIREQCGDLSEGAGIAYKNIMKMMIKRKEKLFPKNNRYILEFELSGRRNDRNLILASTLEEKQYKSLATKEKRKNKNE